MRLRAHGLQQQPGLTLDLKNNLHPSSARSARMRSEQRKGKHVSSRPAKNTGEQRQTTPQIQKLNKKPKRITRSANLLPTNPFAH